MQPFIYTCSSQKNRAVLVSFNEDFQTEDGIFTRKNHVKLTEHHMTLSWVNYSCLFMDQQEKRRVHS